MLESYFFAIAMGLVVGSFVNVLIARLPENDSVVHPGSRCPACRNSISWRDNIPVLSYLMLGGRCRHCKKKISVRYPVVELLTAGLFLAARIRYGFDVVMLVRDWPWMAALVAIVFIDIDHRIIPDELSIGGMAVGLLSSWAVPQLGFLQSALGLGFGYGVFFLLSWGYEKWTGRIGLGGGDVKLLGMLGAYLGFSSILTILIVSSVSGSMVGLVTGARQSRQQRPDGLMKVAIPFGPFLVLGALVYYFVGDIAGLLTV